MTSEQKKTYKETVEVLKQLDWNSLQITNLVSKALKTRDEMDKTNPKAG